MATSGSTNFTVNCDEMIAASLRYIGVLGTGETPTADQSSETRQAMNMMLKLWQADGLNIYLRKRATLFLQEDTNTYNLGPSGDHATTSYSSTTLSAAEASGQIVLSVTSTTGMTASDYIGVEQDDGTLHWSTISSTGAGTVTIASATTAAAASGNKVYWYTTKVSRPIDVVQAFIRDGSIDYEVRKMEYGDYWRIYDKTTNTRPTRFSYDPQMTNGILRINYEPTDVTETMELVIHRPVEDLDAGTDDIDVPVEYYESIKVGTAARVAPEYGIKNGELWNLGEALYQRAKGIQSARPRRVIPTRF